MLFHKAMFDYIKGHDIMTILSCRNTHQTMQFNANLYKIAITYYNMGLTISFILMFLSIPFLALNKFTIFLIFFFLSFHFCQCIIYFNVIFFQIFLQFNHEVNDKTSDFIFCFLIHLVCIIQEKLQFLDGVFQFIFICCQHLSSPFPF